jgi:ParB family chromosome partitioning protein
VANKPIDELRPDPRNKEMFHPLEGEEVAMMVETVEKHGLINPITVTPDGLIIAGEQRWRAAKTAGLETVPVTVRKVKTDDEIDELRIIENLVSRTVQPYEYALNLAHLIRITKDTVHADGNGMRSPVMSQVAERLGVHRDTVTKNQTISQLIPQLGQLLNDGIISQFAAYQLGRCSRTGKDQFSEDVEGGVEAG